LVLPGWCKAWLCAFSLTCRLLLGLPAQSFHWAIYASTAGRPYETFSCHVVRLHFKSENSDTVLWGIRHNCSIRIWWLRVYSRRNTTLFLVFSFLLANSDMVGDSLRMFMDFRVRGWLPVLV
jgi:hypothetical protein